MTALNAKAVPESELVREFSRVFVLEATDAIQWAFRNWRAQSPFFPAISDIRERIELYKRMRRQELEEAATAQAAQDLERARTEGKLVDIGEVRKVIAEVTLRVSQKSAAAGLEAKRRETLIKPREDKRTNEEIQSRRELLKRQAVERLK